MWKCGCTRVRAKCNGAAKNISKIEGRENVEQETFTTKVLFGCRYLSCS
jgi:hypothetical protein